MADENVRSRYFEPKPGLGGPSNIPPTTGNRYYVDSGATNTSNNNTGLDSGEPLATIDGAVGKCTANQGDQIIVKPGHAENISAATSLVMDVAGVSVFGLGEGNDRPVLTYTAAAGSIEIDTASCRISNVRLLASVTEVVVAINMDANFCRVDHCQFDFDEADDEFDTCVDMTGVTNPSIDHNDFRTGDTAGADNVLVMDGCDNAVIAHNNYSGQWNAIIVNANTVSLNISVHDNVIYNSDTSDNNGIEFTVASTGVCYNNRIHTLNSTFGNLLDPGSLLCSENYATGVIDSTALVIPAATTT